MPLFFLTCNLLIINGLRRSLVKLSGLVKSVIKMAIGCLRMAKVAIFAFYNYKGILVICEIYGTLSIFVYGKKFFIISPCFRFKF